MAKRKKIIPTGPPMKHLEEFKKFLGPSKRRKKMPNTHCGFRLINQLPLYRIDTLETVE